MKFMKEDLKRKIDQKLEELADVRAEKDWLADRLKDFPDELNEHYIGVEFDIVDRTTTFLTFA